MKTNLLAIIRSEKCRRNAPAVVAFARLQKAKKSSAQHGVFLKLRREAGVIRRCLQVARRLSALPVSKILLPGIGHKYNELRSELLEAGANEGTIDDLATKGKFPPLDMLRLLIFLMRVRFALFSRAHGNVYWEVIAYYLTIKRALTASSHRHTWPVIGDLSPWLIAFARAAEDAKHQVVAWQYGYLDFKRFPVRPTFACVLNTRGLPLARRSNPSKMTESRSYWRPGVEFKPVDTGYFKGRPVGVMLKAQSGDEAVMQCVKLAATLDQPLEVRLHPNSRLKPTDFPHAIKVCDPGEKMSTFLRRVGLVICGNTTAQLEAVAEGRPVVQCAGLDPLPFDTYRFHELGIVPGVEAPEALSIQDIESFYSDPAHAQRVQALLGPPPTKREPSLTAMINEIGA